MSSTVVGTWFARPSNYRASDHVFRMAADVLLLAASAEEQ